MKRELKKIMSAVLCATMIIPAIPAKEAQEVQAQTAYTDVVSRESVEVALRMGVIADSQFTVSATHIDEALQLFKEIDETYDGLAMAGDVVYQEISAADATSETVDDAMKYVDEKVYDKLVTSLTTYAAGIPYIYGVGNHEYPVSTTNEYVAEAAMNVYKKKMTDQDLLMDKTFQGFHFITAAPKDYSNALTEESEAWLQQKIDAAIATDGVNKPIFVICHKPIQNTTYSSGSTATCYSDAFRTYLQSKPQVIVLTGHTHYATNDPLMIWQDGFTVASMGCTGGGMNSRIGKVDGNEANLIEVDGNNVVSIYRIDVESKKYIGEPWVLDIPAMVADIADNDVDTSVWKYTDARKETAATPAFSSSDEITVTAVSANSATISFPDATVEGDEEAIAYRVQVINKKTQLQVQDYRINSNYYKAEKSAITTTIENLSGGTTYTVKVSAISPYDKVSAPLTAEVKTNTGASSGTPVTDTRPSIKKHVTDSTNTSTVEDGSKWGTSETSNAGWGLGPGQYVQYSFTVTDSGRYELFTTVGTKTSGSMSVAIKESGTDMGTWKTNIVVPSGNLNAKNRVSAGFYDLVAGATYTVKFTSDTGSSTIQMWSAELAKEYDSIINVIEAQSASSYTGGHMDEGKRWSIGGAKGTATYSNVNIPKKGTYHVYLWYGAYRTNARAVTWKATIDNKIVSNSLAGTGGYGTYAYAELGSLELDKGTFSLTMENTYYAGAYSLRRIILVQDDAMAYEVKKAAYEGTANSGADVYGSATYPNEATLFNNGWISFTVTPEHSGIYDIVWKTQITSTTSGYAKGSTYINDKLFDERNYTQGTGVEHTIHNVWMYAGENYTIKLADAGEATFGVKSFTLVYNHPITLADGIVTESFVGDVANEDTNVPEGENYRYGNGTGNAGWSFSSGSYVDFVVPVTSSGLYKVFVQYGNTKENSKLSVSVNGKDFSKNAQNTGDFNTKVLDQFAEVVLMAGTNRIRVSADAGGVHLFKLQLTSVRDLIDTDPYAITRLATSYNDFFNGSNDYDEHTNGGVLLPTSAAWVEYHIDVPYAGNYAFSIKHGRKKDGKGIVLTVNGETIGAYALPSASNSDYWKYDEEYLGVLSLEEGVNIIKIQRGAGGNPLFLTLGSLTLEKIEETVSEIYQGDCIVPGTDLDATFTGSASGDMMVRTYLPATMKGKYVQLVAGVYDETGALVRKAFSKPSYVGLNSIVVTTFEDAPQALADDATYTWKVQGYVQDTPELGGVSDGSAAANGNTTVDLDSAVYAAVMNFQEENAAFTYRNGLTFTLLENGTLSVTGLSGEAVTINPADYGFTTFKNQAFELQITTETTDVGTEIGIWVDKDLANGTTYIVADVSAWNENVTFTDGVMRYSLWRIAEPDAEDKTFVELVGGKPYIVTGIPFTDSNGKEYSIGDTINTAGEYTAVSGVQTTNLVLWRRYDLRADDAFDARDLVALKKYVADREEKKPTTIAGQIAESCLTSAYEIFNIRKELAKQ